MRRNRLFWRGRDAPIELTEVVMDTQQIAGAIGVFTPFIRALMVEAERTGASGPAKHEAVVAGAEQLYGSLQGSIKELKGVPWVALAPIVAPLVSILVTLFNRLLGKLWVWATDLLDGDAT